MARSPITILNPLLLALPLMNVTPETGMHSDVRNIPSVRKLVIVPSCDISAVKVKEPGHCLSLLIDEPFSPASPENVPPVCARTVSDASQWDDEEESGP